MELSVSSAGNSADFTRPFDDRRGLSIALVLFLLLGATMPSPGSVPSSLTLTARLPLLPAMCRSIDVPDADGRNVSRLNVRMRARLDNEGVNNNEEYCPCFVS